MKYEYEYQGENADCDIVSGLGNGKRGITSPFSGFYFVFISAIDKNYKMREIRRKRCDTIGNHFLDLSVSFENTL